MRLPPYLLALLGAGAIAPGALAGCGADARGSDDPAEQGNEEEEPSVDQEALGSRRDAGRARAREEDSASAEEWTAERDARKSQRDAGRTTASSPDAVSSQADAGSTGEGEGESGANQGPSSLPPDACLGCGLG